MAIAACAGDGSPDRRAASASPVVDDLDALHAHIVASDAAIEMPLRDTGHGSRDATCRDPRRGSS